MGEFQPIKTGRPKSIDGRSKKTPEEKKKARQDYMKEYFKKYYQSHKHHINDLVHERYERLKKERVVQSQA
jgi:hypothetical protein